MNRQEILDKAVAGILEQGQLAQIDDEYCVYWGPGDIRCAIGLLLPMETAEKWAEFGEFGIGDADRTRPVEVIRKGLAKAGIDYDSEIGFLSDLQRAHDLAHSMEEFIHTCNDLANHYNLKGNYSA